MKKRINVILFFMLLVISNLHAQVPGRLITLNKGYFKVKWSREAQYPIKVSWQMTFDMAYCPIARLNMHFVKDPELPSTNHLSVDYVDNVYLFGRNFNVEYDCKKETVISAGYYYTNVTLICFGLYYGPWKKLIIKSKEWLRTEGQLTFACGSFGKLKTTGSANVWVPTHCWKVIKHKDGHVDAYLFPNDDTIGLNDDLTIFQITHKSLEDRLGFSVFK